MEDREPKFWDIGDIEHLQWDNIDDAVEHWVDDMTLREAELPETITVFGYALMNVDTHLLNPLQMALEFLDEEYGNPDGVDWSKPTERMIDAEKEFLKVIKEEYTPWACERVTSKEINLQEWLSDNRQEE